MSESTNAPNDAKSSNGTEDNNDSKKKTTRKKRNKPETKKRKIIDLSKFQHIISLVYEADKIHDIKDEISNYLKSIIEKSQLQDYLILFIYQPYESIDENVADKIYNAIPKTNKQKSLLILNSPGGQIEPAYLISKCLKEYSEKFVVSIPRKAKSAATLISMGANEIHMGTMSELGPIDPQFGGLPALGLSSALERLAKLSTQYPESSEMFAKYLSNKLDLGVLGYFERVSESAVQYAQRLLTDKKLPGKETPESVAHRFVYFYKDHSFVIDKDEVKYLLGEHIKTDTPEYKLGNEIHNFLEQVNLCTRAFKKKNTSIIGTFAGVTFSDKD